MKNEEPSKDQLAELRAEHGTILECESEGFHVVLAKPSKETIGGVYLRFKEKSAEAKTRASAIEGLFWSCLVYPEHAEMKAVAADLPGLPVTFGQHALELIGIREANVKKS